jgi:hypothetical protein
VPNRAVWYDVAGAVQSGIVSLGLTYGSGTPLPSGQVDLLKLPLELTNGEALPRIMVCLGGREIHGAGTFEDRARKYPVLIVSAFASNQDRSLNVDPLSWMQSIIDMLEDFESTIRPNVTSADINQVEITPDVAVDQGLFKGANIDVGAVLAVFDTLRARNR